MQNLNGNLDLNKSLRPLFFSYFNCSSGRWDCYMMIPVEVAHALSLQINEWHKNYYLNVY